MYRAEALRVTEIRRLNTLSRNALENLQRVFPDGVRYANGTFRSWFCTEKPHSMTHCQWAENYETVGRILIISTCVTESRTKSAVKTPARKTNNQWLYRFFRCFTGFSRKIYHFFPQTGMCTFWPVYIPPRRI